MEHKNLLLRALTLLEWVAYTDDASDRNHPVWPQFHALINEIKEAVPEERTDG
jgi:hypothetical protein